MHTVCTQKGISIENIFHLRNLKCRFVYRCVDLVMHLNGLNCGLAHAKDMNIQITAVSAKWSLKMMGFMEFPLSSLIWIFMPITTQTKVGTLKTLVGLRHGQHPYGVYCFGNNSASSILSYCHQHGTTPTVGLEQMGRVTCEIYIAANCSSHQWHVLKYLTHLGRPIIIMWYL